MKKVITVEMDHTPFSKIPSIVNIDSDENFTAMLLILLYKYIDNNQDRVECACFDIDTAVRFAYKKAEIMLGRELKNRSEMDCD